MGNERIKDQKIIDLLATNLQRIRSEKKVPGLRTRVVRRTGIRRRRSARDESRRSNEHRGDLGFQESRE